MKKIHHFSKPGFTVVELVVVIIVVAILATLSFVGYGEIRRSAYNTQVIAGVVQYRDTIEAYKAFFRKYPTTTSENNGETTTMVCLGVGYPDQYCGVVSDVETYEDEAFNIELAKVGEGGAISVRALNINAETFVGAVYGIDRVDGGKSPTGWGRTIQYALDGENADCKIEGAWVYSVQENPATTACEIILEVVPER